MNPVRLVGAPGGMLEDVYAYTMQVSVSNADKYACRAGHVMTRAKGIAARHEILDHVGVWMIFSKAYEVVLDALLQKRPQYRHLSRFQNAWHDRKTALENLLNLGRVGCHFTRMS